MSEEDGHVSNDDAGTAAGSGADLSIRVQTSGDRTIFAVDGEIDLYTAPVLRERVVAAVGDAPGTLVIDLSDVPFMDSSGLGVIVGCLKRAREAGGDLTLVTRPRSAPTKLLSLTGLDRAITTYPTTAEALR